MADLYKLTGKGITKNGHTMFIEDVVKNLNYLNNRPTIKKLTKYTIRELFLKSNGLWDRYCDFVEELRKFNLVDEE